MERREQEFLGLSAEELLVKSWDEHPRLKGRADAGGVREAGGHDFDAVALRHGHVR
jgi:hypothetical protein